MTTKVPLPELGISFKPEQIDAVSNNIDRQTGSLVQLQAKSGDLGVTFPAFGVIGYGVASAHDKAIAAQSAALERGREALASWRSALKEAAANYRAAESEAGDQFRYEGPQSTGGPGGPNPEMPKIPNPELPSPELPEGDLPGGPGTDLPGTDLPGTDLPGGDLPGTGLPGGDDVPGTGLPGDGLPGTDLPGTGSPDGVQDGDLPNSGLPGVNDPNMKVPDIDSALNAPQDKTDLSSYDPRTQPNPNLTDLNARTGTTLGSPTGSGNGVGSGNAFRAPGVGAPGSMSGGMPMMPMMPMTGAGSGQDERDREQGSLLSEDEGVWADDTDLAPEVIGKE
ncbi:WXG100 family type VII secretion target [Nonomuraea sp. NPDC050790]|uniref:WXG100 family type VII secretion target n=1 Tax=Nonomuraea sp. NPDC050790 TaxID=3364371 RepID=UPI0037A699CD